MSETVIMSSDNQTGPMEEDISASQHLRNLSLVVEYKHCLQNAPAGVYIIPEIDSIRIFHGVIFIRRGLYRNGIFRFTLSLPEAYNTLGSYPVVTFTPPIFNPCIDSKTGILDFKFDPNMKEWNPQKHFITSVLTLIKKAFYMKSYSDIHDQLPNEEARQMFDNDKDKYLEMVKTCVEESLQRVYVNQPANCSLPFTEPKPAHDITRQMILSAARLESNFNTPCKVSISADVSPDKSFVMSPIMDKEDISSP